MNQSLLRFSRRGIATTSRSSASWFAFIGVFLVASVVNGVWGTILVALLMAAYGGFILWRTFHLRLVAYPDEIVVRNLFRTRRIPKVSVDGFRIGSPRMPLSIGRTIVVLVSDDTAVSAARGHDRALQPPRVEL